MKKVMLSAVILLPIVVLMVLLVSSTVVGTTAHVYVNALDFENSGDIVLKLSDEEQKPSVKLDVIIKPLNAKNKGLNYETLDDDIAVVDENGILTAVNFGQTYVKVSSVENSAASCNKKVIVTDDKVHRLEFVNESERMYVGSTMPLTVKVIPEQAENKQLVWESSDKTIITVAEDGTLYAFRAGTVTVTAKSVDTGVTASVLIESRPRVDELYIEDPSVSIVNNPTVDFPEVFFLPASASEPLTYTTSDESIGIIDELGKIRFLQAGEVSFTAQADDGLGNIFTVSKTYIYTGGYYTRLRFDKDYYHFDYNDFVAGDRLPINLITFPADVKKEINVTMSYDGVVDYRNGGFYLAGADRCAVEVTASAETYDGKPIKTSCFVKVDLNVTDIDLTSGNNITLTDSTCLLTNYLDIKPANHTDRIEYSSDDDSVATVGDSGFVRFDHSGKVNITVTAFDDEDNITCSAKITLNYVSEDTAVFRADMSASGGSFVLSYGASAKLVPSVTDYESKKFEIISGDDVISIDDEGNITSLKGGTASVKVTIRDANGATVSTTVKILVDKTAEEMKFSFQDGYRTAKKEFAFTLTIAPLDAANDKELKFNYDFIKINNKHIDGDKLIYDCVASFKGKGNVCICAGLYFEGTLLQDQSIDINSTYGTIDALTLMNNGAPVFDGQGFVIPDIGKSVLFTIAADFVPSDFELKPEDIYIGVVEGEDEASYLFEKYEIDRTDKEYRIKLTAKNATYKGSALVEITVGGITRSVNITIQAPAQVIEVFCGNRRLESMIQYSSLWKNIELIFRLSRTDGKPITDRNVKWTYGEGEGLTESGDALMLTLEQGYTELTVSTADGKVSQTFIINITDKLKDFGLQIFYTANSVQYMAADVKSVVDESKIGALFPKSLQDRISMRIILPEDVLGGFSEESMVSMINFVLPDNWDMTIVPEINSVILTPPSAAFADDIIINFANYSITLSMRMSDIGNISFEGYDINNSSDVYRGLQQVRVFAKHSYYDGKQVDYFKIPVKVDGSSELLNWTLSGVKDGIESLITAQNGRKVYYMDKEYTLEKDGSLVDEFGAAVVKDGINEAGIPFVDSFTESGFARLYFGNFSGLTEDEIKKDGFGDFDETGLYNLKGGAFMRIEANDGTEAVKEHFNFNVVEDITESVSDENGNSTEEVRNLVNIVDVSGFIANKYIVLQTDLYGPDEFENVDGSKVLESDILDEIQTELIYGNGYSVNYRARSLEIIALELERDPVKVGRVYNTVLKGTTPDVISNDEYRVAFVGTVQYYCDVQACAKGLYGEGEDLYVKNTIYRYIKEAAIQLIEESRCDVENVVIVDVLKGLETMYDGDDETKGFYIKGFLDVINFRNEDEPILGKEDLIVQLKSFVLNELRKSGIEVWDRPDPKNPNKLKLWANIVMANSSDRKDDKYSYDRLFHYGEDEKTNIVIPPNDEYPAGNSYIDDFFDGIYTWGLQRANSKYLAGSLFIYPLDIAAYTYKDRKDITIDCQLNSDDTVNSNHLAWHMNRAYRHNALVGWDAKDHDSNLASTRH